MSIEVIVVRIGLFNQILTEKSSWFYKTPVSVKDRLKEAYE